ncbi:L-ribulose-5-phosphate 3-epimerase [Leuconostoc citreum]|uniref:L-ribulose-5-phosphate 3-epimerase n=1 Tax=Leuconostoc citreum TaxID=33964 RepID=UPI001C1F69F1|nr:L-ribulose-5-phosphate 3-epimerase [Leuconostoc citreum]MBU7450804.1 L-ribulose-5-phosphate 3-epimerase [Leuconostoc citreum]
MSKIGINEKSLPYDLPWSEKLALAKEEGYSFVELSIDETEERLARLDWSKEERLAIVRAVYNVGIPIDTMMLSALRKTPLGSEDDQIYEQAYLICRKAILLACDLGVRNIQIAGYDEYYGKKTVLTRENFIENLQRVVDFAAENQVMISVETMDDSFMNSISKIRTIKETIKSPWLQTYPDLGNISAWPENDPSLDLESGLESIVSIHLKDTLSVTANTPGKFKDVGFGSGQVNFLGLLKTLKRIGYQGTYTVEMWNERRPDAVNQMRYARAFFEQLFKKANIVLEDEYVRRS